MELTTGQIVLATVTPEVFEDFLRWIYDEYAFPPLVKEELVETLMSPKRAKSWLGKVRGSPRETKSNFRNTSAPRANNGKIISTSPSSSNSDEWETISTSPAVTVSKAKGVSPAYYVSATKPSSMKTPSKQRVTGVREYLWYGTPIGTPITKADPPTPKSDAKTISSGIPKSNPRIVSPSTPKPGCKSVSLSSPQKHSKSLSTSKPESESRLASKSSKRTPLLTFTKSFKSSKACSENYTGLIELCIFASRLEMSSLTSAIIDYITLPQRSVCGDSQANSTWHIPDCDDVILVYESTSEDKESDEALRKVVAQQAAFNIAVLGLDPHVYGQAVEEHPGFAMSLIKFQQKFNFPTTLSGREKKTSKARAAKMVLA
jgi:hypothetical protein